MARYSLLADQWIEAPRLEVAPFFEAPENLELLTPPFLGFRIKTQGPIQMRSGTLIDYSLSLRGIPLRWRTLIEEFVPGHRFVDVQVRGPYRRWRHVHTFSDESGGTRLRDQVELELPLGRLGDLAFRFFVRRDLEAIFAYRGRVIAKRFGGQPDTQELHFRKLGRTPP